MLSHYLPTIEIHNTGYTLQNKTSLTGWYASLNWQCLAKNSQNDGRNTGGPNRPKLFWVVYSLHLLAICLMPTVFDEIILLVLIMVILVTINFVVWFFYVWLFYVISPYFMSQIVFYFLHSTWISHFYTNGVLTLFIRKIHILEFQM